MFCLQSFLLFAVLLLFADISNCLWRHLLLLLLLLLPLPLLLRWAGVLYPCSGDFISRFLNVDLFLVLVGNTQSALAGRLGTAGADGC